MGPIVTNPRIVTNPASLERKFLGAGCFLPTTAPLRALCRRRRRGACLRTALRLRAPLLAARPLWCGQYFGADSTLARDGFTHLWIKNFLNAAHPQPPSRHWTKCSTLDSCNAKPALPLTARDSTRNSTNPSAALACALTQGLMRRHGPAGLMAKDPSSHPGRPVVISSVTASSKGLSQHPGRSIKGSANYLGPLGAANYGCTGG